MRPVPAHSIDEVAHLTGSIFERHPDIQVVYLFGSRAGGEIRATSDYDFGVLCARSTPRATCLDLGLRLVGDILKNRLKDLDAFADFVERRLS